MTAAGDQRLTMVMPKKATTQLAEFADFIAGFTRNLLEDDEPVPIIRQMMLEAGYIDYIKESAATPAQEKTKLDNIEILYSSIQSLINRAEDVDEKNIESVIRKMVLLDMLEQQQEEEDTDNKKETVFSANSIEELLQKLSDHVQMKKSDAIITESEKMLGNHIDFSA